MEVLEDASSISSMPEGGKTDLFVETMNVESAVSQACQKSNGVVDSVNPADEATAAPLPVPDIAKTAVNDVSGKNVPNDVNNKDAVSVQLAMTVEANDQQAVTESTNSTDVTVSAVVIGENLGQDLVSEEILESQTYTCPEAELTDLHESTEMQESADVEEQNSLNVSFETEILVEENLDLNESTVEINQSENNHILNEFDGSMELNEVLNSADAAGNVENNNCSVKQEVFNKEELLDILQGKHDEQSECDQNSSNNKPPTESEIALRQLSRLRKAKDTRFSPKKVKNKMRTRKEIIDSKKEKDSLKRKSQKSDGDKNNHENKITDAANDLQAQCPASEKQIESDEKDGDSIVDVLVKDWEDEEPDTVEVKVESDTVKSTEKEDVKTQEATSIGPNELTGENQSADGAKSGDEGQPRRLGRVIKKKIIFDPDNPDTFTKGKTPTKPKDSKEPAEPPVKTRKIDSITPRPKSKSPVGKAQWKKPTPKGNKNYKRLSEVDKLLMDEGAVNMIYQLTPEVSKGKKTMRTKAEIIKKMQSSTTTDGNEMKFRERKKELKEEEAKKILGGKQRSSMSSSVKSVGEDFETHSADDSIIYRRHSSSSYSSSCMSPRRMSDVEINAAQPTAAPPETTNVEKSTPNKPEVPGSGVFVPENEAPLLINKELCLNLKQKLNSRLSQALNKRKRESVKTDKPTKQMKVKQEATKSKMLDYVGFKYLTVKFDQKLAEICITQSSSKFTIPVLKELELALSYVDKKNDVSVTLLTSTCGTIISPTMNLQPLLDNNIETRTNSAHELAEAIRLLLCAVQQHSKLVVSCVWGECGALCVALLALCDVPLAGERASFAVQPGPRRAAPLAPGMAVFTSGYRPLPPSLLTDLVVFNRRLSSLEAVACGLVTRVLWPENYLEQARALVKEIALQPTKTIQLKKRLLSLKNNSVSDSTFLSSLEAERDMFVEYWTSVEGQELLRAYLTPV